MELIICEPFSNHFGDAVKWFHRPSLIRNQGGQSPKTGLIFIPGCFAAFCFGATCTHTPAGVDAVYWKYEKLNVGAQRIQPEPMVIYANRSLGPVCCFTTTQFLPGAIFAFCAAARNSGPTCIIWTALCAASAPGSYFPVFAWLVWLGSSLVHPLVGCCLPLRFCAADVMAHLDSWCGCCVIALSLGLNTARG